MKSVKILFLSLFIYSCAPIYVTIDYEKGINFIEYKTYNFYQDINTDLSTLDNKRLFNELNHQLQLKGLIRSETPDFYINIHSKEFQDEQRNTIGVGVGGSGRNIGGGVSVGIPMGQSNLSRQIVFEFVDEDGIGLFWQAVSESRYNPNATPNKRESNLKILVEKVFKKYPPKSK